MKRIIIILLLVSCFMAFSFGEPPKKFERSERGQSKTIQEVKERYGNSEASDYTEEESEEEEMNSELSKEDYSYSDED